MNELNEKAINMCQALIGFKPGVSDEEIDTAISTVTSLPMFAGLDKIELKKSLLAIYNVKVDTYQILEGRDARIPWLKEFKAERRSEWQFWTRYKKYLAEQKHFAPEVISQLDDLTDRILDKLFNPQRNDIVINKKGLVVGQVQSGKTANYTGLICKAADAGFNLIIILAGIHNNLRSQTQNRIDEGFLGFDTQNTRAYDMNRTIRIGVGLIPGLTRPLQIPIRQAPNTVISPVGRQIRPDSTSTIRSRSFSSSRRTHPYSNDSSAGCKHSPVTEP